jgi:hypothetical protein
VWISHDVISSNDDYSIVLNVLQNAAILMAMRVFVNTISIPFVVAVDRNGSDEDERVPECLTYMRKSVRTTEKTHDDVTSNH